jgi:serine/threonine protein kinase
VAVKVSREQFTERFGREARAIAALNHSNVCHLYDVGPNYLVMELVEGEPVRGPLPLDEALPVLRQLIDGIEAAHEKGITHRDLKPANLRITPDGVVKILDFGFGQGARSGRTFAGAHDDVQPPAPAVERMQLELSLSHRMDASSRSWPRGRAASPDCG